MSYGDARVKLFFKTGAYNTPVKPGPIAEALRGLGFWVDTTAPDRDAAVGAIIDIPATVSVAGMSLFGADNPDGSASFVIQIVPPGVEMEECDEGYLPRGESFDPADPAAVVAAAKAAIAAAKAALAVPFPGE